MVAWELYKVVRSISTEIVINKSDYKISFFKIIIFYYRLETIKVNSSV